ncbi:MAG TPA: substrate-binding domain-containing protein [Trichocoleus sp.]
MNTQRKTSLLLLALTTTLAVFLGETLRGWQPTSAQKPPKPTPTFTPPASLAEGTRLNIDGSPNMTVINQALEEGFEGRYPGSDLIFNSSGSDPALQSLLSGSLDLAAVGRSLTDAEQAQGLTQVPISREKVALIVGQDNPFKGDITSEDFAKIFRGQITNWSQLGGPNTPIRFIDHPESSDIRQALSEYALFKKEPFQNGRNVIRLETDDTAAIVRELGADGLSYAISSQVMNQDNVRVLTMHGTLPDDPRYPYSQPRGYVYRGEPSIPVEAFLGFATNPDGQEVVAQAKADEAATVATAELLPGILAVSPDGQMIVRGTQDGILEWYDGQGNSRGVSTQAHSGLITGLSFTPDGQSLISSGSDGTIRRWDLQGNPLEAPIQGSDGPVTALAVSPDGEQIVSGNNDGTVQRWAADGKPVGNPLTAHQGTVRAIAFSPDGQTLITGGSDSSIRFWNQNGIPVGEFETVHSGGVTALASSATGQFVVSGGENGTLQFWDANGQPQGNLVPAHTAAVTSVAISPDGQTVASAGQDNLFRLWDPQGNPEPVKANTLSEPVSDLAYKPNGDLITGLGTAGPQVRTPQGAPRSGELPDLSRTNFNLPPEVTTALDSLPPSVRWVVPGLVALLILGGLLWSLFGGRHTPKPAETEDTNPSPRPEPSGDRGVDLPAPPQNAGNAMSPPSESAWVSLDPEAGQDLDLGGKLGQAQADLAEGTRLAQEGRYDDAFNTFNNAIEAAEVERMKAIAAGTSLVSILGVLSLALARRGGVLAVLGRTDSALDSFNRALEMDADSVEAWVGKGRLLSSMGRADEALFCFDKALELDPTSGPAWAGKGRTLIQIGRSQEGQTCLNKATELGGDGETTSPVPNSGDLQAREWCEPAASLDPDPSSSLVLNPMAPAPYSDAVVTSPAEIEEDVPQELHEVIAGLPSAVEEIQPTAPLTELDVPQHLQAVIAELPDDSEIPEHAFISSSEIVNPDEMELASPSPLPSAIALQPQALELPQPQLVVDPIDPLDASLPAPEALDAMTEALQASVDLSTVLPSPPSPVVPLPVEPLASLPVEPPGEATTETLVALSPNLEAEPLAPLPVELTGEATTETLVALSPNLEAEPLASLPVELTGEATTETLAAPSPNLGAEPLASLPVELTGEATTETLVTFSPAAELDSQVVPDVPDPETGGLGESSEMGELAAIRPDNPDENNTFADLPPEVLAALSSIPADSPDSFGIALPTGVLPQEPPSAPAATLSSTAVMPTAATTKAPPIVVPPPVPANPRLVQSPMETAQPSTGSWITLSVPREEDRLYTAWEIVEEERTAAKRKGGDALAVRLYDVTNQPAGAPLSAPVDEQECYELARDWYVALPKRDRTYLAEIGYKTAAGDWLKLARSSPLRVTAL